MLVKDIIPTEQVVDILCDTCGCSTKIDLGSNEFGTLSASFGYGSLHDSEKYQVHLCESCFFETLAYLRETHRQKNMFDPEYEQADINTFGRFE